MINKPRTLALIAALVGACAPEARHPGTYQGVVELDERLLGFEVGGRLASVSARRGAEVEAGAVLAALDDTLAQTAARGRQAEAAAAAARAALVGAGSRVEDIRALEAQVRAAAANEALLQKNLARDRTLVEHGALPQAVADETLARARTAEAEHQALQQRLREARAGARSQELEGARAQADAAAAAARLEAQRVERHRLRAQDAGTVLEVHAEPGEVVAAGAPVVTVADATRPYVDVFVPQDELAGLDVGDPAAIHVDALAAPLPGAVESIGRRTEFTPRYVFSERERATLVVRVRIRVDDRGRALHAGVPAFAAIERGGPAR